MTVGNWPADNVERWALDRLIPFARNARTHSARQVEQIAASMREWGWTNPVLVDEAGMMYDLAAEGQSTSIGDPQGEGLSLVIAAPDRAMIVSRCFFEQPTLEQALGDVSDSAALQCRGDRIDAAIAAREGRGKHGALCIGQFGHDQDSSTEPGAAHEDKPRVRASGPVRAGSKGSAGVRTHARMRPRINPFLQHAAVRGRKPTPTAIKMVTGNPGKRRLNKAEPQPSGDLYAAPEWLSDTQREGWAYAITHAPYGLLKQLDRSVLAIWVVAEGLHREAATKIAQYGLLTKSPNAGLPLQSPYLAILNKQAQIMLKAGAELGFSPSSRSRVQVDGGGAKPNGEADEWDFDHW